MREEPHVEHDPVAFATQLGAKLATRSRHVCAFLGAGAARACGLPDIASLQAIVVEKLDDDDSADDLARLLVGRNLEQVLSRLRRIAALVEDPETVDGFTSKKAEALDAKICAEIIAALDLSSADLDPMHRFAAWVGSGGYHLPLEIFTVNYDLLIETALEHRRVPYFDGFLGALTGRFHTDLVEDLGADLERIPSFFVRLWKIHGSVNWSWRTGGTSADVVRLGSAVEDAAAIYPSDAKYEESRRVPFVVLQDRLRRSLHLPETLLLISGYSFGDEHLNELFFEAASGRPRSEIIAFCYDKIPDVVAKRAELTPNLQLATHDEAVIGGIRAPWKAPADDLTDVWEDNKFAMRDFKHFAAYLARSSAFDPGIADGGAV